MKNCMLFFAFASMLISLGACKKVSTLRTTPSSNYTAIRGSVISVATGNDPYMELSVKIEGSISGAGYTPIVDFKKGDFAVTENGGPVIIDNINYYRTPVSIALVLDRSGSMLGNDPDKVLNISVINFINKLFDSDRIAIINFSTEVEVVAGFNSTRSEAVEAVESSEISGWTNLWEAAGIGLNELNGESMATKILVVLSDGNYELPGYDGSKGYLVTVSQVVARAQSYGLAVNTIGFTSGADNNLSFLSAQTNGVYRRADSAIDLYSVFDAFLPSSVNSTGLHYRTRISGQKDVVVYLNYGALFTSFTHSYQD